MLFAYKIQGETCGEGGVVRAKDIQEAEQRLQEYIDGTMYRSNIERKIEEIDLEKGKVVCCCWYDNSN